MSLDSLASASDAVVVTPSNTVNFTRGPCRSLYVGSGGNIAVVIGGETITFANAAAGSVLPIKVSRVDATGTTASSLLALY
jgi:hypothetical protein